MRTNFNGSINSNIEFYDNYILKKFNSKKVENYFREKNFYLLANELKIETIPRLLDYSDTQKQLRIQKIHGSTLKSANQFFLKKLTQTINLLSQINCEDLQYSGGESINSTEDFLSHLEKRVVSIHSSEINSDYLKSFVGFLEDFYSNISLKEINIEKKILNMSDVGVHNSLHDNNMIFFIDFEYAGKDSYLKFFYDFILHPANKINDKNFFNVFSFFKSNIYDFDVIFDENILRIFSFWWVLRIINNIQEDTIENKLKSKILSQSEVKDYIKHRENTAKLFISRIL